MSRSDWSALLIVVTAGLLSGCGRPPRAMTAQSLQSPVAGAGMVPQVTSLSGGRLLLSWQTPLEGGGYSFAMAIRKGPTWSEARHIASGPDLSMFTADLPGVAELPGGGLLAYWELKDSRNGDPYATTIQTSVSRDEGKTWSVPVQPYGAAPAGQHSFLCWFSLDGGLGLVWLDAAQRSAVPDRLMSSRLGHTGESLGSIGLRYVALNPEGTVTRDFFIDPITCECCSTGASITARGPVVVYRGRQEPPGVRPSEVRADRATVRDIYITRLDNGHWTRPHRVHADNWVINACPDNGPAVDADGNRVAVAWWTQSNDTPKVLAAFSSDAGETFGPPIRIDSGQGEGQVTVALLPGGKAAVIGWREAGQTWARWASRAGVAGPAVALGRSLWHARLPKWIAEGGTVTAVWTSKAGELPRVEVSRLSF